MLCAGLQREAGKMEIKTARLPEAFNSLKLPDPHRNLFSSPEWLNIIYKTYGTQLFIKYTEENGVIGDYIIYSVVHNFLEDKICVCSYCDYFDCCVRSSETWRRFIQDIRKEYPCYRIAVRNLKDPSARACKELHVLSREYFHEIDLTDSIDKLWREAFNGFRGAVKQAQKAGVSVRQCSKEYLRDFYRLHLRVRKNKYGIFPQPYRFFENIWDEYMPKGNGFMLGAFDKSGRFIAANIYLVCGDTLYYKFSTSLLESLEYRPNNILIWEGIKIAKERRLKTFDMGSSGLEQHGLIFFKTHIVKPVKQLEIHHLGCHPADYKFSQKRILKAYTKFFTQKWMPDFVVEFGSNFIYPLLA